MLSNQDFANFIKSAGTNTSNNTSHATSNNTSRGGKEDRFDLKQVANWEKQNKTDQEKKKEKKEKSSSSSKKKSSSSSSSNWDKPPPDAAADDNEKKKNTGRGGAANSSTLSKDSEELIAKLDDDQTKFLGGDMEHTHLVKGLDFALLAKMKEQTAKDLKRLQQGFHGSDEEDNDDEKDANDRDEEQRKDLSSITPVTKLGMRLKAVLLKNREIEAQWNQDQTESNQKSIEDSSTTADVGGKLSTSSLLEQLDKSGRAYIIDPTKVLSQQQSKQFQQNHQKIDSIFQRSVYEFNINPQSEKDVPMTIVKSRKVSFFLSSSFSMQISQSSVLFRARRSPKNLCIVQLIRIFLRNSFLFMTMDELFQRTNEFLHLLRLHYRYPRHQQCL